MLKIKFFISMILVIMMAVPSIAGKVKTAKHKDNILTDLRYGYTLDVLKNWKVKTFKEKPEEPEVLRALLLQKNYQINREARDLDADFTRPEIQIYVYPETVSADDFMEQLKSDVETHNSKHKLINQMNLILSGEYIGKQRVELGGAPAIQVFFKRQWKRIMQGDPYDPRYREHGGRIVRNVHDVHEVYILNHNDCLYVIQAITENEFYSTVRDEFAQIISSIKFEDDVSPEPVQLEQDK